MPTAETSQITRRATPVRKAEEKLPKVKETEATKQVRETIGHAKEAAVQKKTEGRTQTSSDRSISTAPSKTPHNPGGSEERTSTSSAPSAKDESPDADEIKAIKPQTPTGKDENSKKTLADLTPEQRERYLRALAAKKAKTEGKTYPKEKAPIASKSRPSRFEELTEEEQQAYMTARAERKEKERIKARAANMSGLTIEEKEALSSPSSPIE